MGRHTEKSAPPAGYTSDEADAYRDGWVAGERSRVPVMGDPDAPLTIHTADDEDAYAQSVADAEEAAEFERYDAEHDLWEAEEDSRRAGAEKWACKKSRREIHRNEIDRVMGNMAAAFDVIGGAA